MKRVIKTIFEWLGILNIAQSIYSSIFINNRLRKIYIKSFSEYIKVRKNRSQYENYELLLRLQVHSIEKLLVERQYKFLNNSSMFLQMLQKCDSLILNNISPSSNIISEVLSAIKLAQEVAESNSIDFSIVQNSANDFCIKHGLIYSSYSLINICEKSKKELLEFDCFENFMKERHSIREFKDEKVSENIIREIIKTAQLCPSTCNRQSAIVYYTNDFNKSNELKKLNLQPCSSAISNYMVVCVNIGDFSPSEAFQSYIDGGIFLQSLVMSIHGAGLGSCLFQTSKGSTRYENYKKILGIKPFEEIICVIGYGHLRDTVRFIGTHRKDIDDVAICATSSL